VGIEIERKFLVRDRSIIVGLVGVPYQQGYLSTDPERTVRVRRAGGHAFVTIKGKGHGAAHPEFEYEIPVGDAEVLLGMCPDPLIEKIRYRIDHAGRTWEIDVFAGANAGLVIAEVEIPSIRARVEIPAWAGPEVTDDPRYYNARLATHPYSRW
jgi:adenylate cyclase